MTAQSHPITAWDTKDVGRGPQADTAVVNRARSGLGPDGLPSSRKDAPGIMPLARKLAEIVGKGPNHPKDGTLTLEPIRTRVQHLNYHAWGFSSQAEMEAAFGDDA